MRLWAIFAVFLLSCVTKPAVQAPLVESLNTSTSTLAACDCPCAALDAGAPVYAQCAREFSWCGFGGNKVSTQTVRFGVPGMYAYKVVTDFGIQCAVSSFSADPAPGQNKTCALLQQAPLMLDAGVPVDAAAARVDASAPPAAVTDASVPVPPSSSTTRPAASKGVGFYVANGKLYDATGQEFIIRGTNKTHQDNQSPGLGKTKSNATRWLVYFVDDPARTIRDMQSATIGGTTAQKMIAIPGFWDGTCKADQATFDIMVNRWVRDAALYQTFEKYMILNIANEFGSDEVAWRDMYSAAIPKIRAAGWHGAISVTAPGCGQNGLAIAHYGPAILAADPEKNVLFDWHVYGNVFDSEGGIPRQWSEQVDLVPTMKAIKASGVAAIIGEFGPGRSIGPSPTLLTPQRITDVADANGIGTLSWSWDDNNLAGGMSDDNSFSHSYNGDYNSTADLTTFGKIMVDYWARMAKPAAIFSK